MIEYVDIKKEEYALQALELAEKNHIRINSFSDRDEVFFISLGKMVYEKLDKGKRLDSISFGEKTSLKIGDRNISFISINQS